MIKVCKKHGETEFSFRKSGRWRCKKCSVDSVQKRRWKIKEIAVAYLGGKCNRCGYNKYVGALDFHHLDPSIKEFNIGESGYTRSWERVRVELDKCELVCANCHREIHG